MSPAISKFGLSSVDQLCPGQKRFMAEMNGKCGMKKKLHVFLRFLLLFFTPCSSIRCYCRERKKYQGPNVGLSHDDAREEEGNRVAKSKENSHSIAPVWIKSTWEEEMEKSRIHINNRVPNPS